MAGLQGGCLLEQCRFQWCLLTSHVTTEFARPPRFTLPIACPLVVGVHLPPRPWLSNMHMYASTCQLHESHKMRLPLVAATHSMAGWVCRLMRLCIAITTGVPMRLHIAVTMTPCPGLTLHLLGCLAGPGRIHTVCASPLPQLWLLHPSHQAYCFPQLHTLLHQHVHCEDVGHFCRQTCQQARLQRRCSGHGQVWVVT